MKLNIHTPHTEKVNGNAAENNSEITRSTLTEQIANRLRDMIIQNPAVPHTSRYLQIARDNRIPIETDLSLFLKICPAKKLIAVGGTKGKSTVTDLIYHIFCRAGKDIVHAGNIGISVFDVLPKIKDDTLVLLEVSSWRRRLSVFIVSPTQRDTIVSNSTGMARSR